MTEQREVTKYLSANSLLNFCGIPPVLQAAGNGVDFAADGPVEFRFVHAYSGR